MTVATGSFELVWNEEPPYDQAEGATLAKVNITKTFEGDLEGTSVTELIKAMTDRPDSAGYVAIERFIGSVHGRKGTMVLQHSAIMHRGAGELSVRVVPDSGTGELTGILGNLVVVPTGGKHPYTFDYHFDAPADAAPAADAPADDEADAAA